MVLPVFSVERRMQSTVARERCEGELRRRLKEAQSKLAHKEKEGSDLREVPEQKQISECCACCACCAGSMFPVLMAGPLRGRCREFADSKGPPHFNW